MIRPVHPRNAKLETGEQAPSVRTKSCERAHDEVGADPTYARHPSQGGAPQFEAGMVTIVAEMGLSSPR